ncbi:MAG: YtxH domain-containing protein [Candidatus Saganbacteria bacterium]|nr:YtxH domain-containing protein [Candidatus Saganbacteria bacterium]
MRRWFKTLFAGGIIGGIFGVLFAPEKGEKSRAKLKDAVEKGKEKFDEIKGDFQEKE